MSFTPVFFSVSEGGCHLYEDMVSVSVRAGGVILSAYSTHRLSCQVGRVAGTQGAEGYSYTPPPCIRHSHVTTSASHRISYIEKSDSLEGDMIDTHPRKPC